MSSKIENLSGFQVGQVWFVGNLVRIARVEEITTVEHWIRRSDTNQRVRIQKDAVRVRVTIPDRPIPGFVTDDEARTNHEIKSTLAAMDGAKDHVWEEFWAVRDVPVVKSNHGALYTDDGELAPQLYCHSQKGRTTDSEKSSPVRNTKVECSLVPAEDVPDGLFLDDAAENREFIDTAISDKELRITQRERKDAKVIGEEMRRVMAEERVREEVRQEMRSEMQAELERERAKLRAEMPGSPDLPETAKPETANPETDSAPEPSDDAQKPTVATPQAKRKADTLGVDLDEVEHEGVKITTEDVYRHVENKRKAEAAQESQPAESKPAETQPEEEEDPA